MFTSFDQAPNWEASQPTSSKELADAEEGMPTAIKHTVIVFLKNHLERE